MAGMSSSLNPTMKFLMGLTESPFAAINAMSDQKQRFALEKLAMAIAKHLKGKGLLQNKATYTTTIRALCLQKEVEESKVSDSGNTTCSTNKYPPTICKSHNEIKESRIQRAVVDGLYQ